MKLIIQFQTNQGVSFVGEASSLVEFDAIRDYLTNQGFAIGGAPAPQPTATAAETKAADAGNVKEGTKSAAGGKGKGKQAENVPPVESHLDAAIDNHQGAKTSTESKPAAKAADSAKTAAGPTLEDVVAEMTKVADEFGVPEALILNKRFGVKKAGELKEAQYADYIKFAKHCIADKIAPSGSHPDFEAGSSEEDVTSLV